MQKTRDEFRSKVPPMHEVKRQNPEVDDEEVLKRENTKLVEEDDVKFCYNDFAEIL